MLNHTLEVFEPLSRDYAVSDLIRNMHEGRFGQAGEVFFSLFGRYINLYNWEAASDAYVLSCARYLNALPEPTVTHLCEASIRYCNDFLNAIGEEPKAFARPRDVLLLIAPISLSIPDPKERDSPVVHLELNCDWEDEHGMEWLVRAENVLYVGAYNDENPWADFSPKASGNYA